MMVEEKVVHSLPRVIYFYGWLRFHHLVGGDGTEARAAI